ncbi:carbohydrate binding domain-containing protein [Candidatus Hecatella orcuttiae]|jgi:hypothetical protein|uniref:carbohydrate binding domain-containing protein n=1 Tax=Candidatus Hecatella orcuttiae TaxID=1935119 RepID=UPI0028681DB7|nr:hypothetical protein [Candidatus Hecatella orcuttiae]
MTAPKVKIGMDSNTLDLLAAGNVHRLTRHPLKTFSRRKVAGGEVHLPSLGPAETLHILEGWLDGSEAQANLQKLLNLYHSQELTALETAKYEAFGKLTDLEIPYQGGETAVRYRLELTELPAWGRTAVNQGTDAYLADLDYAALRSQLFSPLWARHGWSWDRGGKKFAYEFILVNALEETSPAVLYDDDEAFWSTTGWGSGSSAASLTEESTVVKKGTSSAKVSQTSGSYDVFGIYHSWAAGQDWSGYEFVALWLYGSNSGGKMALDIRAPDASNKYFAYIDDTWTGWKRLVYPLRAMPKVGSPDLTNVKAVYLTTDEGNPWAPFYLDRMVLDVGQWVAVEVFVPDTLNTADINVRLYSWDGSGWVVGPGVEATDLSPWSAGVDLYFLDGTKASEAYGGNWYNDQFAYYSLGERGQTPGKWSSPPPDITYSLNYGCLKRLGFAVKMPPSTLARDTSGSQAVNKTQLKLEITYNSEHTTYVDGSL